jgi:hypothetical protein
MRADAERYYASHTGIATLFVALLLPPWIWLVHLTASFAASEALCAAGRGGWLHVFSLVAIGLSLGAGAFALRNWHDTGDDSNPDEGGTLARSKFLAIAGLASSAFFTLALIAAEIPNLMLGPCDH